MAVPLYYINMSRREDRRQFMENQLLGLGLTATRIEAATPADISPEDVAAYCNRNNPRFLRENELACTMSHERVWQQMLADGHDCALVLEDDAVLSQLLPGVLDALGAQDFDIIRIEAVGKTPRVLPKVADIGDITLLPFRTQTNGSAAYVIKARAARRMLGNRGLRLRPIDVALFSPFEEPGRLLTRVLASPALAVQLAKPAAEGKASVVGRSDIRADDRRHDYALKHPIAHRLRRLGHGAGKGLRNIVDHLLHLPKGLRHQPILFKRER